MSFGRSRWSGGKKKKKVKKEDGKKRYRGGVKEEMGDKKR